MRARTSSARVARLLLVAARSDWRVRVREAWDALGLDDGGAAVPARAPSARTWRRLLTRCAAGGWRVEVRGWGWSSEVVIQPDVRA